MAVDRVSRPVRTVLAVVAGLLLSLGLASCADDSAGSGNGAAVSVEAFSERVAEADVVLDVRTPAEYAAGHLPDAVNIDVQASDFASRVDELDRDATYAVYCRSGNRSAVAVDHMVEAGFTDVRHLDGGIVDWQRSGEAVETGS